MLVIPLFQENQYLMGYSQNKIFGFLRYYYGNDHWEISSSVMNELTFDITNNIKRPSWPREQPWWGLKDSLYSKYKSIFWRRSSEKPERRGPRWFRCLMVNDNRVLVRDIIYGGYRKRCDQPITQNWWRFWNVYEPMSCQRTYPKEDWYPKYGQFRQVDLNRQGMCYLEEEYHPNFGYELEASYRVKAGYPIKHEDMFFTPVYYYFDDSLEGPSQQTLYSAFYTIYEGKIKLFSMRFPIETGMVFWTCGRIDNPNPKASYSSKGAGFLSYASWINKVPKKPNMNTLADILRHADIVYFHKG